MMTYCVKKGMTIKKHMRQWETCKHCPFFDACEVKQRAIYLGYIKK